MNNGNLSIYRQESYYTTWRLADQGISQRSFATTSGALA